MPGVFISYRREDTSGEAAHLADDLGEELGRSNVFIDIDAIAPGVDFAGQIDRSLQTCELVLVMIGDRWLASAGVGGRPRLHQEDDFVRMEVAKALARDDVRVVPVLVESARMPAASELPPELADLTKINALQLSNSRWRYDVGQIAAMVPRGGLRGAVRRVPPWVRWGLPVAAVAAAGAILVAGMGGGGGEDKTSQRIVLPPASVPPVVDECSKQLEHAVDGTVGPLTCEGGKINQLAWQQYAGDLDSLTLSLGPNATPEQVAHALCSDLRESGATYPIVGQLYEIAKLYYGWQFGIDPTPTEVGGITQC
jgi:hypothetical protein